MSEALAIRYLTPDEYLAMERQAEDKSEYINGEIEVMTGGSYAHSSIAMNTQYRLRRQLEGRPCAVHGSDLRVMVDDRGAYFYPDVIVVCGEPQLEDRNDDTLLNPTVVVEVLSPSTELRDRGVKVSRYLTLPALQSLLLIAQDRPHVERYERHGEQWVITMFRTLDDAVELPEIGATLPLGEIYEGVDFPSDDEVEAADPI